MTKQKTTKPEPCPASLIPGRPHDPRECRYCAPPEVRWRALHRDVGGLLGGTTDHAVAFSTATQLWTVSLPHAQLGEVVASDASLEVAARLVTRELRRRGRLYVAIRSALARCRGADTVTEEGAEYVLREVAREVFAVDSAPPEDA